MKLSDQHIKLLLEKFVNAPESQQWRDQRKSDHLLWDQWVNQETVQKLSDEELKQRFLEYFHAGAGRHPFNHIYRDRIIRDPKKFRDTLTFLLDETISLKERINEVLNKNGKHHIEGLGRGLTTSLLMDLNPQQYVTWNNKTDKGLETLGCQPSFERGDDWGTKYEKILEAIREIQSLNPQSNFLEIDHFLHIVAVEPEGQEAVRALVEGKEVLTEIETGMHQIQEEKGRMEFAMEKYLEEFIEANFDKIDFKRKLLLHEDEEGSGRQYPTPIGNIDLLAIDKNTEEFVVFELKKGRSGDIVVGQILRYMGWVQENLAKERSRVNGIIIANDLDKKLEYALKMISNVELFIYSVSFELTKVSY
ncbi:MAG: endonuclease NucS [bacterium]|nr:endonuclease NucS [bacterium]